MALVNLGSYSSVVCKTSRWTIGYYHSFFVAQKRKTMVLYCSYPQNKLMMV